jgi:CRP-like cAMP-binding protein
MTTAHDKPVSVADLRPVDLFDDLDDGALAEFAAAAEWHHVESGTVVLEAGEPTEGMFCLLDGTLQLFQRDGDRFEPIGRQTAPTWIGAIATLTEGDFVSRMVAVGEADLALIPSAEFRRLALANPDVHRRIGGRDA